MERILRSAISLREEILCCQAYEEYLAIKKKIDGNGPLKDKIMDYQKKLIAFGLRRAREEEVSREEERALSAFYADLMLNDDARKFILAQRRVTSLLSQVYEEIGRGLELELEFLE